MLIDDLHGQYWHEYGDTTIVFYFYLRHGYFLNKRWVYLVLNHKCLNHRIPWNKIENVESAHALIKHVSVLDWHASPVQFGCTRNRVRVSPAALGLDRLSFSILCNTNKKVRSRRPSFRAANTKVTQTSVREATDNAGSLAMHANVCARYAIYESVLAAADHEPISTARSMSDPFALPTLDRIASISIMNVDGL